MPSVVMNDGTRRKVVITPFASPTAAETRSAATMPSQSGRLCFSGSQSDQTIAGASAKTRPTREVDLAADEEHHLAGRDQRDRGHRLGDVLDVVAFEEDAVLRLEEERQRRRRRRRCSPRGGEGARRRRASRGRRVALWSSSLPPRLVGRYETGYFCFEEEPSYRVFVVRYGLTFSLVTNSRPVFVSEGATRPPDSL